MKVRYNKRTHELTNERKKERKYEIKKERRGSIEKNSKFYVLTAPKETVESREGRVDGRYLFFLAVL